MRKKNTKKLHEPMEALYGVRSKEKASSKPTFDQEKFMQTIRRLPGFQKVRFIVFHGSAAEGRALPDSDIDICIYYEGTPEEQWTYRKNLLKELPDKYDIQIFQQLPLYVRKEVLKGRPIYVKDKTIYDIAYDTIKEYEDYHPFFVRYVREGTTGEIRADLILAKLRASEDAANFVEENLPGDCRAFTSQRLIKGGIYKEIEYAIESIIDACAILNSDLSLGTPADTDDIIKKLEKAEIITKETAQKIKDMKQFRNVLVHKYGEIDDKQAYEDIKEGTKDIRDITREMRQSIRQLEKDYPSNTRKRQGKSR